MTVLPREAAVIDIFALKIRRIAVDEIAGPVVMLNQDLKILIFEENAVKTAAHLPYQSEHAANGTWLTAEALAGTGIAEPDQKEEHCGSVNVAEFRLPEIDISDFLRLRFREQAVGEFHFFIHIFIGEFLFFQGFFIHLEIVP